MRRLVACGAALISVAVAALAAYAVTRPDPSTQAVADGCGRNDGAAIANQAPEWAYVNDRDAPAGGPPPPPQWLAGTVNASGRRSWGAVHVAGGDIPTTHRSYDLNVDVLPDPDYQGLMGGDPAARTGNFAGEVGEAGRVHTELEEASIPTFAWPEVGNRIRMLGSWVWDCGHWLPGGERTELHPLRLLWVERRPSTRSAHGESEGDLFVTTDKTGAGKVADCAHRTKGDGAALKACIAAEPNWQDVSGSYSFFLPAPPRPSPRARLTYRVVDGGSTAGAPALRVTPQSGGVSVSLRIVPSMTAGLRRLVVARKVFAGWTPAPARALPLHLRLRFVRLVVRRAMDPACGEREPACRFKDESTNLGQISALPGEWNVYWDVAGTWSMWKPAVLLVRRDGQSFRGTQTVDFYVPRGSPWRLFVWTRECDYGSLAEGSTRPLVPCPPSNEIGVRAGDDVPGAIVAGFRTPLASLGLHRANSLLLGSTCPASNRRGCYELTYRVTVVPGVEASVRKPPQPRLAAHARRRTPASLFPRRPAWAASKSGLRLGLSRPRGHGGFRTGA